MRTFPNIKPTYGSKYKTTCRVLKSSFGDGYVQRAPDGLNNVSKTMDFVWTGLTSANADRIIEFLEDQEGSTAFYFTLPRTTTKLKWICSEWEYTWEEGEAATISATFEQVFDL